MHRYALQMFTVAALFAAFTTSSVNAAAVDIEILDTANLQDLIDETDTLEGGGLSFTDFLYTTAPDGLEPDAEDITVRAILDNSTGYFGLEFQGNFEENDGANHDWRFAWNANVIEGPKITDVHLCTVLRANEDGENGEVPEGTISVVGVSGVLLDSVFNGDNGDNPAITQDWEFTVEPEMVVPLTIDLGIDNGFLSIMQVTYSREIPAPAALPAGLAMIGLVAARRRK